jgi:hypothetical protein
VPDAEHQVTPLELFFDLVFVFAITQFRVDVEVPMRRGERNRLRAPASTWKTIRPTCLTTQPLTVSDEEPLAAGRPPA